MNKHNVVELEGREILSDPLTEMLRDGICCPCQAVDV